MLEGSKDDAKCLSADFEQVSYKEGRVILEVGSGSYHITFREVTLEILE